MALAAVFGAMSLTNPAFAAVGAPADAELTERTFSPQVAEQVLYIGQTEATMLDISSMITGGGAQFKSVASVTVQPTGLVAAYDAPGDAVTLGFGSVNVNLTPGSDVQDGRVVLSIVLQDDSRQRITIPVDVVAATSPTVVGEIDDMVVGERPEDVSATTEINESDVGWVRLDVSEYFENGKGTPSTSVITNYEVISETVAAVEVSLDPEAVDTRSYSATVDAANGMVIFRAGTAAEEGDSSFITVKC